MLSLRKNTFLDKYNAILSISERGFLCWKYIPLYKKGIKENEKKSMETTIVDFRFPLKHVLSKNQPYACLKFIMFVIRWTTW